MANVTVQKHPSFSSPIGPRDPAQMFGKLFDKKPLQQLAPPPFVPAFEVRETKDSYVFRADMPGVKDAALDVNVAANRMTISGTRETEQVEESDTVYTEERTFGAFTRSFMLPEGADADHVQAALQEGVLTIAIPKAAEAKAGKTTIARRED